MILKQKDDASDDIAVLKQLLTEAPQSARARIEKEIKNIKAGVAGERDAAHFLARAFGESSRMAVLNDLRLEHEGETAQIDHLVIHRFQAAAWVLETKNYSGRLTCDEHGDWTVWSRGKPRSIPSPVNQARRQCALLRSWLAANNMNALRRIEPVVLISPTSSVDRSKLTPGTHVVKSDNFSEWWDKQADGISASTALRIMGKHVFSGMSKADLVAFGQQLIDAHKPLQRNWRAKFGVPEPDEGSATASLQLAASPSASSTESGDSSVLAGVGPWVLTTEHGAVRLSRIPNGAYAIRNEPTAELIEVVKGACKGRGRWNPRFRNWLVEADQIGCVLAELHYVSIEGG